MINHTILVYAAVDTYVCIAASNNIAAQYYYTPGTCFRLNSLLHEHRTILLQYCSTTSLEVSSFLSSIIPLAQAYDNGALLYALKLLQNALCSCMYYSSLSNHLSCVDYGNIFSNEKLHVSLHVRHLKMHTCMYMYSTHAFLPPSPGFN